MGRNYEKVRKYSHHLISYFNLVLKSIGKNDVWKKEELQAE